MVHFETLDPSRCGRANLSFILINAGQAYNRQTASNGGQFAIEVGDAWFPEDARHPAHVALRDAAGTEPSPLIGPSVFLPRAGETKIPEGLRMPLMRRQWLGYVIPIACVLAVTSVAVCPDIQSESAGDRTLLHVAVPRGDDCSVAGL